MKLELPSITLAISILSGCVYSSEPQSMEVEMSRVIPIQHEIIDLTPQIMMLRTMQHVNTPIYVLLNSPGGNIDTTLNFIEQIHASHTPVYTVCVKRCANAAALIHQHGHKRLGYKYSILVFHQMLAIGTYDIAQGVPEVDQEFKAISQINDGIKKEIAQRAGFTKQEFDALVANELWVFSVSELAYRFFDGFVYINVIRKGNND